MLFKKIDCSLKVKKGWKKQTKQNRIISRSVLPSDGEQVKEHIENNNNK